MFQPGISDCMVTAGTGHYCLILVSVGFRLFTVVFVVVLWGGGGIWGLGDRMGGWGGGGGGGEEKGAFIQSLSFGQMLWIPRKTMAVMNGTKSKWHHHSLVGRPGTAVVAAHGWGVEVFLYCVCLAKLAGLLAPGKRVLWKKRHHNHHFAAYKSICNVHCWSCVQLEKIYIVVTHEVCIVWKCKNSTPPTHPPNMLGERGQWWGGGAVVGGGGVKPLQSPTTEILGPEAQPEQP